MATEPSLQLPSIISSRADVARLSREFEALGDYLHQAALRHTKPEDLKLPKTSRMMDEFVALNKLDVTSRSEHQRGQALLTEASKSAPVLHFSFSAEPSGAFLAKLVQWLRQNIHPLTLVQVGLRPNIAAGCIVRTKSRQYDLSLAQGFSESRQLLIEQLRGVEAHG